ncbi:MAG: sigma-54-dependent transcriptional regulator [Barnesiella sp.]
MNKILIVEDDITYAKMLKTWLSRKGFDVVSVSEVGKAEKYLAENKVSLILSDLRLPDRDGIELLVWIRENDLDIPLIVMTGYAGIQSAVQAMKLGAVDYVEKPMNPDALLKKIEDALNPVANDKNAPREKRKEKNSRKQALTSANYLEGESEAAKQLYNYVRLVAPTSMSVLINGASGTGKEYVARQIHYLSKRSDKPFVAIDCGAIPRDLAASEFFGHKKGSFTGALSDKIGAFEAADGGTIFLDEVGNLNYDTQIQLLRVLQERKIRPVGSNTEIPVDVRLISATNENLQDAMEKGNFRDDLYHRINEFTIRMPQLCERKEDILLFADFFLDRANKELGKDVSGFEDKALQKIRTYSWPGNLRQMINVIKRATLLTSGRYITSDELDIDIVQESDVPDIMPLRNVATERERIIEALQRTGNNKSKAAELLQIDRKTLYNKLKLYHIEE